MNGRTAVLEGGCQCGRVRYAFYTEPTSADICHCRMCQRAMGNLFMAAVGGVGLDDFAWTRGEPARFQSSSIAERFFCRTCGTPLGFRYLERPTISVTTGSLDRPEHGRPTMQIGIESRLPWLDEALSSPAQHTEDDPPPGGMSAVVSRQS
ncbi:MAG: GFA family protein [Geminicoccaceae bacterium]|nr:GFA family protein [Geminicoccaceae bacterium]